MNKEDLAKLNLTDEQVSQVMALHKEELKNYVPNSRLSEVVKEKNDFKAKVDEQLKALSTSTSDIEGLKKQIVDMQVANDKAMLEATQRYEALQLDTALSKMATESGAYDVRALKAYLNVDDAKADSDGVYRTIQSQIDALKADTTKAFLFKPSTPNNPTPQIKGANIDNGLGKPTPPMGYQERWRAAITEGKTAEAISIKNEAASNGVYF